MRQSPADFAAERCVAVIHAALGRSDIAVEIEDITSWEQGVAVADRFRSGRIFLAGDSAHVWSPAGGIGANTGVQDAHNLAWKLAAVIGGWAGPSLVRPDGYVAWRDPQAADNPGDRPYRCALSDPVRRRPARYQAWNRFRAFSPVMMR